MLLLEGWQLWQLILKVEIVEWSELLKHLVNNMPEGERRVDPNESALSIELGSGQVISFEEHPPGVAQFYSTVLSPPRSTEPDALRAALSAHLFGVLTDHGVFGRDPQTEALILFKTIKLNELADDVILAEAASLLQSAQQWYAAFHP